LRKQLFYKIEKVDILEFSKKVLNFTKKDHNIWLKKTKNFRKKLHLQYSKKIEIVSIKKMLKNIINLIN
jgi:hypothetical protein